MSKAKEHSGTHQKSFVKDFLTGGVVAAISKTAVTPIPCGQVLTENFGI